MLELLAVMTKRDERDGGFQDSSKFESLLLRVKKERKKDGVKPSTIISAWVLIISRFKNSRHVSLPSSNDLDVILRHL